MRTIALRRLATCAAATCAVSLAAPAGATAASYGGGALTPAAPLVSVRVAGAGPAVEIGGEVIARCANGSAVDEHGVVRSSLRPDGTFAGTASRTYRVSSRETRSVRISVAGVIAQGRVRGALWVVAIVRRTKQAPVRCDSRNQAWQARGVPVAVGAPGAAAPGSYYGATTQRGSYLPYPLALRVSSGGTRVDAAIYRLRRRCRGAVSDDVANNSPAIPIRPDGSFSNVQRYSQRFTDSIEDFTFVLRGRFFAAGAAGMLRGRSVVRDLRTRKVIGSCDSGPLIWTAGR